MMWSFKLWQRETEENTRKLSVELTDSRSRRCEHTAQGYMWGRSQGSTGRRLWCSFWGRSKAEPVAWTVGMVCGLWARGKSLVAWLPLRFCCLSPFRKQNKIPQTGWLLKWNFTSHNYRVWKVSKVSKVKEIGSSAVPSLSLHTVELVWASVMRTLIPCVWLLPPRLIISHNTVH